MIQALIAALALGTLALAASPAAAASPTREHLGGCGYHDLDPGPQLAVEYYDGELYSATVVFSGTDPAANPVPATVECTFVLNGEVRESLTVSGTGVVHGGKSIAVWPDGVTETAEVCTHVGYDNGETDDVCRSLIGGNGSNVLAPVIDLVNAVFLAVEPTACTAFVSLAPGVPGVVDITPEGDVYLVELGFFWDCPPYDPS